MLEPEIVTDTYKQIENALIIATTTSMMMIMMMMMTMMMMLQAGH